MVGLMSSHDSQRMLGRLAAAARLHLNPDIKMIMVIWNRNKGFIMGFWRWINSSDSLAAVLLRPIKSHWEHWGAGVFRFYSNDPSTMTFKCKCVQVIFWDCMSGEEIQNEVHSALSWILPFRPFDLPKPFWISGISNPGLTSRELTLTEATNALKAHFSCSRTALMLSLHQSTDKGYCEKWRCIIVADTWPNCDLQS